MTQDKNTTLTIQKVDPDLKSKFKAWCAEHGVTMRAKLLELVETILKEKRK